MLAIRSIRLRLTLWYVLLLAVILAGFSAGIYVTLRHNLYANLDDSLQTRSADLLPLVRYEGAAPTLTESVSLSGGNLDEQFVRVYDNAGRLTFDDSGGLGTVAVNGPAIEKALAGGTATRGVHVNGEPFRVRVVPIQQNGATVGAL